MGVPLRSDVPAIVSAAAAVRHKGGETCMAPRGEAVHTGLALMFVFCSNHRMSTRIDPSLLIPPHPVVIRFVPAAPVARQARRALRDFTGFLVLAWVFAEIALWAGGA
jgi:hypothetical protein